MKRVFLILSIAVVTTVGFDCPWLPDPPTPASPADGAVGVSTNPTLKWEIPSSVTSCRLQVSNDLAFSSIRVDERALTASSYQVLGLSNSTTYYWRVSAAGSYGTSNWSTVSSFTTVVVPPGPPTLTVPANGLTGITTDPMLCWNPPDRAASYWLQVSTDSSFSTIVFEKKGITSSFCPDSGLTVGTRYYWRVSASNAGGTSDWSQPWSFTPGGL